MPPKNLTGRPYRLFLYVHCTHLEFWVGPQFRGGGRRGRDGTVRKSIGEFLGPPYSLFIYQHIYRSFTWGCELRVHHTIPTDSVSTDAIPTVHSRDVGWMTAVE